MPLTPEAKKLLSETIRGTQQDPKKGLRAKLLSAIHDEADRRYRLSVPLQDAGLDEAHRRRRERIEAWIDERARATKPKNKAELNAAKARLLVQAEKEAAATCINRLVLLRQLEAYGLSKPSILTGGWNSKGYREFREFAPTLCTNGTTDASEGYGTLLQLVFDELAVDIPGLFGNVGLTKLFPIPAATLREVVERLDDPDLASAWTDDTTLGWVYQYWNDPDREALDAKINGGGKIEPHEIASKTQMFTERYMVEWLLQNSLGLTWLCMCKKRGWTADAERVLPVLDARRVEWRAKRDAGEVALDALMPIQGEIEDHWKYYVPQPLPDDAVEKAPTSVQEIKLLDPACGSGHFLVTAFEMLAALYREEGRHTGVELSDAEIARSILDHNLHGIDIDPRAIQIAAAGLYLKAKSLSKHTRIARMNLVAPALQLGNLPADDKAVVQLRDELRREVGISDEVTDQLLKALAGVDYLGSLLRVSGAVDQALQSAELAFEREHGQGDLFGGFPAQQVKLTLGQARATILDRLERFLAKHSRGEDLGLRLDGEQLAAGVRFVRIAKEQAYDIVVGNPPYQGLSKTQAFEYVASKYPRGKADLYAAFLERGLELIREGGVSALLTMRGWMFLGQFEHLRKHLLHDRDVVCLGDVDRGGFQDVLDEVLSIAMSVVRRASPRVRSIAIQPTSPSDRSRDASRTRRKQATLLAQVGRYEFDPRGFCVIDGQPIVYWWSQEDLERYRSATPLGNLFPIRKGLTTGNDIRFLRLWWEVNRDSIGLAPLDTVPRNHWIPYFTGGTSPWIQPVEKVVNWHSNALEIATASTSRYGRGARFYFRSAVGFSMIGQKFSARAHRFASVLGDKGGSVFSDSVAETVCLMNSTWAQYVLESLNPSVCFQVSDVARLPTIAIKNSEEIFSEVERAFLEHEQGRETSIEFVALRPSRLRSTLEWTKRALDLQLDTMELPNQLQWDKPTDDDHLSLGVGEALGHFEPSASDSPADTSVSVLRDGILFLFSEGADSLDDRACTRLKAAWVQRSAASIHDSATDAVSMYVRRDFFRSHKQRYENRPIYFPLSSAKKNFVAFVSIHRWQDDTLNVLLADHLVPTKRRLDGELDDLRTARASGGNKGKVEKRFAEVQKLLEELNEFIAKVTEVAEKGPPPPDDKTPKREVDARYVMDLDDGVMVNSAALWPLLEPQWKDPKKWWKELATAQGKKDYDWAHLSARYFPTRVRKKCHEDPSLAVAHKCFWELHPAKAYAWELRLQDEIRPDFTIDEPGSDAARAKFLSEQPEEAAKILANELKRRARKAAKEAEEEDEGASGPLFDGDGEPAEEPDDG
jgi:Eco57I restriction-modification methylase